MSHRVTYVGHYTLELAGCAAKRSETVLRGAVDVRFVEEDARESLSLPRDLRLALFLVDSSGALTALRRDAQLREREAVDPLTQRRRLAVDVLVRPAEGVAVRVVLVQDERFSERPLVVCSCEGVPLLVSPSEAIDDVLQRAWRALGNASTAPPLVLYSEDGYEHFETDSLAAGDLLVLCAAPSPSPAQSAPQTHSAVRVTKSVDLPAPPARTDARTELREHFAEMGIALREAWVDELLRHGPSLADIADYYFKNTHRFRDDAPPPIPLAAPVRVPVQQRNAAPPRAPEPVPAAPAPLVVPPELRVFHERNPSLVENVLSLGFSLPLLVEALKRASSVEAVVDYVMSAAVGDNGEVVFQRRFEEAQAPCAVCEELMLVSELLSLDCDHRICSSCLEGWCSSKIAEGQISDEHLCCPCIVDPDSNTACRQPFSEHILRANLPSETMSRYDRFKMRSFCEKEDMCRCVQCNDWYVDIPRGDSEREIAIWRAITCGKCAHVFCGRCGREPHRQQRDLNMSCEEFARRDQDADEAFEQWRRDNVTHNCPGCGHCAEKLDGCNYLYCRCGTDFCNLCGVKLNRSIKFEHFFNSPFGNACRGVEHGLPN